MKTTIRVEQWDIDNAKKYTEGIYCSRCPVALAAQRAFRDKSVCMGFLYLTGLVNGGAVVPRDVRDFIQRFDQQESVDPFTFELEY